jgi:hypothetical protein
MPTATAASRRGTILIAVMGVSTMVLVIGLGAVAVSRIHARTVSAANDFAEARICARAGLEVGMLAIAGDPYWRTNFGDGDWFVNRPVGSGSFTLSAADPTDSSVRVGDNHPVVLTSTGAKGDARYLLSVRMEVGPRTGSCLEASLCASRGVTVIDATLTSDQTIRSNTTVTASGGATVNADVEAVTSISGATYTQDTAIAAAPSIFPAASSVFDPYTAAGTVIPYSSLLQGGRELIGNGTFELTIAGWSTSGGCSTALNVNPLMLYQGLCSLRVTGRDSVADNVWTTLPANRLISGHTYALSCPVYSPTAATMRVSVSVQTDRGSATYAPPTVSVPANTWTVIKIDTPAISWSGSVKSAILTVESSAPTSDFYLDAVSLRDTSLAFSYLMDGQVLSPATNPYGAPNARGIYILNCAGRDVVIANSRVVGTLVLLNPGPGTMIAGSVAFEPAESTMPALMTDGKITLSLSRDDLSESQLGVNFNPPGVPYPFESGAGSFTNATATDTLRSGITGLVYSKADLAVENDTLVSGVLAVDGAVAVNASSLTLHYSNRYLINPPPGFASAAVAMRPVPGSWKREVR